MRNPFTRRNLLLTAALALLAACDAPRTAVKVEVIPQPQSITPARGTLLLPSPLTFSASMSQQDLADLLAYLPAYPLPLQQGGDDAFLRITVSDGLLPDSLAAEGYCLDIDRRGVRIGAATPAGAFYGLQTLAQLARGKTELPCLTITDAPRFPYRGLHLDVSRHFFSKEHVMRQIDRIAAYKMNRLHWHLTDGGGCVSKSPATPN